MRRKDDPTGTDDDSIGINAEQVTDGSGDETVAQLGRRSYLKLGAATAAAATGTLAMGSGAAEGEDYDVITVPAGGHESITVGAGETFENVIIDISEPGAGFQLTARGDGWTLRNIGVRGRQDSDNMSIVPRVPAGGEALMENIYLGDGSANGVDHGSEPGGIWLHWRHEGWLTMRNINVSGFCDNGFYCSGSGYQHHHGSRDTLPGGVGIEQCYARNNNVSQFRIGSASSYVKDSVAVVDGWLPPYSNGAQNGRGLWAWNTDIDNENNTNVHITNTWSNDTAVQQGSNSSNYVGSFTLYDSEIDASNEQSGDVSLENVGSDPTTEPPEGVPMSAEEAASGGSSGGSSGTSPTYDNLVVIEGAEGDADASYQFAVDGDVEPVEEEGATVDDTISVENGIASGDVTTDSDAFRFSGEITAFEVDGPVAVYLDGEEACLSSLERRDHELPTDLDHSHMTIHNVGDSAYDVEFGVTGDVVKSSDYDSPLDPTDCIHDHGTDGASVEGDVGADSKKTFYFTGTVEELATSAGDGDASLWVDGEQHDADSIVGTGSPLPDDYHDTPDDGDEANDGENSDGDDENNNGDEGSDSEDGDEELANTLVISGVEGDLSRYEFEVSGELAAHEERGTIDWSDRIEDNAAEGYVHDDDVDAYRFSGSLTSFRLQGSASVVFEEADD